eukprot:14767674-Heterocapsa_arctica.AAC.1
MTSKAPKRSTRRPTPPVPDLVSGDVFHNAVAALHREPAVQSAEHAAPQASGSSSASESELEEERRAEEL